MKTIVKLLILQISLAFTPLFGLELKSGDVLLMELRCYSCSVIADETGSRFSHSAVVIGVQGDQVVVAQALGKVHPLTLEKFKTQKVAGTSILVMRPLKKLNQHKVFKEFSSNWVGRPFDSGYTWDDEKLYCSEFVAKFLETFLGPVFPPKPLDFSRNWDYWQRVLPHVPQGEPGNSPGDFEFSDALERVGEIY